LQSDERFQSMITALSICKPKSNGTPSIVQSLPSPRFTRRVVYWAEPVEDGGGAFVGERVGCLADDMSLSITLYRDRGNGGWFSRTDLHKTGVARMVRGRSTAPPVARRP